MKRFVIFGHIEATDAQGTVLLMHNVEHAGFYSADELEAIDLDQYGGDYILPHYFDGQIIFAKFHKETT
jgi:hypothetical protein